MTALPILNQQKIGNVNYFNSVVISYCEGVAAYYIFVVMVFYLHQVADFTGRLRGKLYTYLHINPSVTAYSHKVTMCGDNQLSPEYGIKPEQLIARVEYLTRNGRRLTTYMLPYRIYALLWRSFFIRRVYFKLRRVFHGGKKTG